MKRILFINPSLRLHSKTKFLPVGIASVMTYLQSQGIKFDFLDIDIDDIEDTDVKLYLEKNSPQSSDLLKINPIKEKILNNIVNNPLSKYLSFNKFTPFFN